MKTQVVGKDLMCLAESGEWLRENDCCERCLGSERAVVGKRRFAGKFRNYDAAELDDYGRWCDGCWDAATARLTAKVTKSELEVIVLLGEAFTKFIQLGQHHPSECREFEARIHDLQRQVMARVTERSFPDIFPKHT